MWLLRLLVAALSMVARRVYNDYLGFSFMKDDVTAVFCHMISVFSTIVACVANWALLLLTPMLCSWCSLAAIFCLAL